MGQLRSRDHHRRDHRRRRRRRSLPRVTGGGEDRMKNPLIRPPATFSPRAGRRSSREIPRPAKRGEGAAKRRGGGPVLVAPFLLAPSAFSDANAASGPPPVPLF